MTVFDEPRARAIEPLTWHRAGRPGWDCAICHLPWPCAPAKVALAEEFENDRVSGTIYLALSMHEAINDSIHPAGPVPAEMWNRFLGWYVALRLRRRRTARTSELPQTNSPSAVRSD